jgi:hypothetical protein
MSDEVKVRVQSVPGGLAGPVWFGGWLFTLGFLKIAFFWKGALAFFLWPYYLGVFFHRG